MCLLNIMIRINSVFFVCSVFHFSHLVKFWPHCSESIWNRRGRHQCQTLAWNSYSGTETFDDTFLFMYYNIFSCVIRTLFAWRISTHRIWIKSLASWLVKLSSYWITVFYLIKFVTFINLATATIQWSFFTSKYYSCCEIVYDVCK